MEDLVITQIDVFLLVEENSRLKAFVFFVLNGQFAVKVKVINGNGGLFVAMPSSRCRDGDYKDMAHPVVQSLRDHITKVVLGEYQRQLTLDPSKRRYAGAEF